MNVCGSGWTTLGPILGELGTVARATWGNQDVLGEPFFFDWGVEDAADFSKRDQVQIVVYRGYTSPSYRPVTEGYEKYFTWQERFENVPRSWLQRIGTIVATKNADFLHRLEVYYEPEHREDMAVVEDALRQAGVLSYACGPDFELPR